jgi:hypothetical protein
MHKIYSMVLKRWAIKSAGCKIAIFAHANLGYLEAFLGVCLWIKSCSESKNTRETIKKSFDLSIVYAKFTIFWFSLISLFSELQFLKCQFRVLRGIFCRYVKIKICSKYPKKKGYNHFWLKRALICWNIRPPPSKWRLADMPVN